MLDPLSLTAGAIVADRYRVDAVLGRGGMGFVFRVFDEVVGEDVALKLLTTPNADAIERFKAELRLARRVTHKNVGRTFDMGREQGCFFITMELVEGESLRAYLLREGRLSAADGARVAAQMAAGLAAAHEARVVHRDLKPANVLLSGDGRVVVIDWGVASYHRDASGKDMSGTPDYMSPEQLRGLPPEPSHDIYALGLSMFELWVGARPFDGPDPLARVAARMKADADLTPLRPLGAEFVELVEATLARDPRSRPAALEIERALQRLASSRAAKLDNPQALDGASAQSVPPETQTLSDTGLRVAVQPFDADGDDASIGVAIAEEIADDLSRVRTLSVVAYASDVRTRRTVDHVVMGTIVTSGPPVLEVRARLVEASSNKQLWTKQFSSTASRPQAALREVAVRITEALRVELDFLRAAPSLTNRAALAYLEGQRMMRTTFGSSQDAFRAFEECLAEAPTFGPAIAGRALAAATSYHLIDDNLRSFQLAAADAIADALARAPELVDTHLAQAVMSLSEADYRAGINALSRALSIAPDQAKAHELLGRVECEAGQAERGSQRLLAALTVEPTLRQSICLVARAHALRGRPQDFDSVMSSIPGERSVEECLLSARVAIWTRDRTRAEHTLEMLPAHGGRRSRPIATARRCASLVLGEPTIWELRESIRSERTVPLSPRLRWLVYQVAAEYEGAYGDPLRALQHVELLSGSGLMDVEWLALCPALDVVRDEERFNKALRSVRERTAALWIDYPVPALPLGMDR